MADTAATERTQGAELRRGSASGAAKVALRGVRKHFFVRGRRIDALSGIDLDIDQGEFFCIVGPSGCGKTTLLRILAGLDRLTEGTIEVARDAVGADGRGTATE